MRRPFIPLAFLLALALLSAPSIPLSAQRAYAGEVELRQALERLNTLGSAMMIGAHPDDERETVLAYLALGRHVRAAYLSLTRGEGGQNLIGPEQGDALGVIRTQELQASRRIDGAEQFFTRAIDFGFSKTAAETLEKWPRDKVLGDVVWNIRRFRPDVIILVFSGTPRDGHGHHQTSAILGREAFAAAADPTKFPEQLAYVQPWQAKRLMMNAGFGGAGDQKGKGKAKGDDKEAAERLDLDVGVYSPELGASFGEIGGYSRSANRSQGTGAAERKGSQKNPMTTIAGDRATKDLFEGMDISWNRLPGGAAVGAIVKQAIDSYVPAKPDVLLPLLARARPLIAAIRDPLAERKLRELDEAMALASGLWLEAQADKFAVSPGQSLRVSLQAVVRNQVQATLTGVRITGMDGIPPTNVATTVLVNNQPSQFPVTVNVPVTQPLSQPYWLEQPKDGALYSVKDPRLIGNPESAPVLEAHFAVRVAGVDLDLVRPVQHRYVDRVLGEQLRPLAVVPPVVMELTEQALLFPSAAARRLDVTVRAQTGKTAGDVRLDVPQGWTVRPATAHFELTSAAGEAATLSFEIAPPQADTRAKVRALAQVGALTFSVGTEVLQYPHIVTQTLFPPVEASLVRSEVRNLSKRVGYVMGAGDEVARALEQLGCEVTLLTQTDVARGDLSRFDAIVTGVRALETRSGLAGMGGRFREYAANGGTVIVQYNQAAGDGMEVNFGPYPFRISRERVTVEEAPVTFPNPDHPLLNAPNKITPADFEGWVQERGIYFADQWDQRYESVLESHDPGEDRLRGGMLYARTGKGAFIYTGYAWFRQLPAGVPGAYRMFANMLSAAKAQ